MANYGRGGVARSSSAQRGRGPSAYDFNAKSAEDYLTAEELKNYTGAKQLLASNPKMQASGKVKIKDITKQRQAIEKARRLREIAAGRVLGDFIERGTTLSKPWLQKASQGLIAAESAPQTLAGMEIFGGEGSAYGPGRRAVRRQELTGEHSFEAVGLNSVQKLREKFAAAQQGSYSPEFFIDPTRQDVERVRLQREEAAANYPSTPRTGIDLKRRKTRPKVEPRSIISNPVAAYTGIGEENTQKYGYSRSSGNTYYDPYRRSFV